MTERINDFCCTGYTPAPTRVCWGCGKYFQSYFDHVCEDCQVERKDFINRVLKDLDDEDAEFTKRINAP